MTADSKIEWTNKSFSPWIGCQKVSPGCDHCYAEKDNDLRFHKVKWGPHGERKRTSVGYWKQPLTWNRQADKFEAEHGHRRRVFCAHYADVFDNKVPEAWWHELWNLITATPRLDWLLLTKRPQNIRKMLPADWGAGWPNVWLGTTTENQEEYDRRWPLLARIPAVVHFISYEPALSPLVLQASDERFPTWVICGGESGPGARGMAPEWARSIRDQCAEYSIAFFMKQVGKIHTGWPPGLTGKADQPEQWPTDLRIREFPIIQNNPAVTKHGSR